MVTEDIDSRSTEWFFSDATSRLRQSDQHQTARFKILLDLYVRGRPATVAEIPIHFDNRRIGSSKLSAKVVYHGLVDVLSLMRVRN